MPLCPLMVRNPVVEVYCPGAARGVVTQVERILPHLLEVDRMGVTMVDPSGAEVTLRDLLVVENPDMMDPAGTTVGLLALREADPEEMALVPGSPTHPWSPIRIHRISLLGGGWGGFPEGFHSEDTESKDGRNYGQLPPEVNGNLPGVCVADRGASREAGLQANRTVVMMINGCSDAEVAACLRGASVRPETIEISLDYLIERDV
ncbi:hypothetical protein DYB31_016618, partial [Aphanomyces astaci]